MHATTILSKCASLSAVTNATTTATAAVATKRCRHYHSSSHRRRLHNFRISMLPTTKTPTLAIFIIVALLSGSRLSCSAHGIQKFCGKSLNEAMESVCVNGYNVRVSTAASSASAAAAAQKRTPTNSQLLNNLLDDDMENALLFEKDSDVMLSYPNTYFYRPFLSNIYDNLLAKTRRRRGGIYDECCRKACSNTELAAYCHQP